MESWQFFVGLAVVAVAVAAGVWLGVLCERDQVSKQEPALSLARIEHALNAAVKRVEGVAASSVGRIEQHHRTIENGMTAQMERYTASTRLTVSEHKAYFSGSRNDSKMWSPDSNHSMRESVNWS
jgi:hypothetical protein